MEVDARLLEDHHASQVTRLGGRIGRSRQEHTLTPSTRAWLIIWMLWKHSFSTPSGTWLQVCKLLGSALPSFFLGLRTISQRPRSSNTQHFSKLRTCSAFFMDRRSQYSLLHEECLSPEGRRKRIRPSWFLTRRLTRTLARSAASAVPQRVTTRKTNSIEDRLQGTSKPRTAMVAPSDVSRGMSPHTHKQSAGPLPMSPCAVCRTFSPRSLVQNVQVSGGKIMIRELCVSTSGTSGCCGDEH